jgi:hypothetical protein
MDPFQESFGLRIYHDFQSFARHDTPDSNVEDIQFELDVLPTNPHLSKLAFVPTSARGWVSGPHLYSIWRSMVGPEFEVPSSPQWNHGLEPSRIP